MRISLKTGDKILAALAVLALVCGGGWWLLTHLSGGDDARSDYVVVTQTKDGQRREDPLSTNLEFTVITPGTGWGADAEQGENTVRIRDGVVEVTHSNCSNQVCVEHRAIAQAGDQIVCLPHGLVVEVAQNAQDAATLR